MGLRPGDHLRGRTPSAQADGRRGRAPQVRFQSLQTATLRDAAATEVAPDGPEAGRPRRWSPTVRAGGRTARTRPTGAISIA